MQNDDVLTIAEVAAILRCSKAHVYKAIAGKLVGVSPLPVINMGRRKLVRRSTLERWKQCIEQGGSGAIVRESPEVHAV